MGDEVESKNGIFDDSVNTVIVYMYGKLGRVDRSRERFDQIGHDGKRSIIVWNSMINAYVQNGFPMEAIKLFHLMVEDCSCRPNHVTMVSVLSACAQIGDLDLGRRVHEYIVYKGREGVLGLNTILFKDVVSFNAMTMGLATNGEGEDVLMLFSKMLESHVEEALEVVNFMPSSLMVLSGGLCFRVVCFILKRSAMGRCLVVDVFNGEKRIGKQLGHSWITVNGIAQDFLPGSVSHPKIEGIYLTLDGLVKEIKVSEVCSLKISEDIQKYNILHQGVLFLQFYNMFLVSMLFPFATTISVKHILFFSPCIGMLITSYCLEALSELVPELFNLRLFLPELFAFEAARTISDEAHSRLFLGHFSGF
ncbi:Pentatricopeptide repeat [Dillenia turbinata]|uniref:Pentatricopeptide repeat n=1 Tax=Dillenia turbinata TaxID=194707 RepID=A0AAN8VQL6_9MAGN